MSDPISRLNAALEGRYRIERELGEGGMATVYLADDLRHERKVALKVLKPELAAVVGAERFLTEIKTTANLQHPHILPLFDSGEADGFLFYVMPYVEGESLRQRLDRENQLPVEEAVRIATDVAEALDYAHRRGVIHRDIKPANILLQDGKPVISDFGIALAVSVGGAGRLTETGLSLGTPHYMSPEQATGDLNVGTATDVYALGCVLYEMLVGEPPYTGATPQAILGKIIAGELASASSQRSSVPSNVDAAIGRALERVPADRFVGAKELARALAEPGFRWSAEPAAPRSGPVPSSVSIAAVVALAGLALWGWLRPPPRSSAGALVSRTIVPLPEGHLLAMSGGNRYPVAISADGSRIVYVRQEGQDTRLYLRNLHELTARPIDGTEGARQPFLSPDGEEVAFFSGTELRRVSVAGGIPARIAVVPPFQSGARWFGGTWSSDGTILYSLGESLWRISADGTMGPTEIVLTMDAGDGLPGTTAETEIPSPIKWPRFLPGNDHALVSVGWQDQAGITGIVEIGSGRFKPLIVGGEPHYLRTGHLALAGSEERVSVAPFDLDRREVTGGPRPVLEGVGRGPGGGATTFTVSETGTLVYVRGGFERSLFVVDRNGRADSVPVEPRGYRFPSLSPDGRTLSVTVDPRPSHIWIVDLERATANPLTSEGYNLVSGFSRDGSRLAWSTNPGVAWTAWPGRDTVHQLDIAAGGRVWIGNEALVIQSTTSTSGRDLERLDLQTGNTTTLVSGPGDQIMASVSPDGRWLAFVGDQAGAQEVYVIAIDGTGQAHQITRGGGTDPRWSWDGSELFYRAESWIVSVDVTTAPLFEVVGPPEPLFTGPYLFNQAQNWDVLPDGRFLMIKGDPNTERQLVVVMNWFEELGDRMGN